MPAMLLLSLQLVHELMKTMNSLVRRRFDALLLPTINVLAKMPGPSRRLAIKNAKTKLAQAGHATIVAAQEALAGRLWFADWLRFLQAEASANSGVRLDDDRAPFRGVLDK
ncbi:Fc.00g032620.m01.CDS01 [Cosmosporella sp. VM-42]